MKNPKTRFPETLLSRLLKNSLDALAAVADRRLLHCMIGIALATQAAYARPVPKGKLASFQIPRMSKPPTIDGKIDAEEWKESVMVSGVADNANNELIPLPVTFCLAWDPEHFYVAGRSFLTEHPLRVEGRAPHSAAVGDDCFEFHFDPMGRNAKARGTAASYKFFINPLVGPGTYDLVSVGQLFKNWLPQFRVKSQTRRPWWEFEMAGSWKDFELDRPQQAGDTWRLMLVRDFIMQLWSQAAVPINSSFFSSEGYPTGTLVENAPCVQMTMEELPGPRDGRAAVKITIHNPAKTPVTLRPSIEFGELKPQKDGDKTAEVAQPLLKKDATLTIPPGATEVFAVNEPFPRKLENLGTLEARVLDGSDRTIYQYFTYFRQGYDPKWFAYTPATSKFPFMAQLNPVRNTLFLTADTFYLENRDRMKELRYRVTTGDGHLVKEGATNWFVSLRALGEIKFASLTHGKYQVEATLVDQDGQTIGPEKAGFEKLDEAKEFAEWWNTKLGNAERVIKPFTPIEHRDNEISCWGRTYRLGALGLPDQIVSQNGDLMAEAARIVVQRGGQQAMAVPLRGKLRFTETKPWRVNFTGKASGAGLDFSVSGKLEQDGLVLVDLTYQPSGKSSVAIEKLAIEYPLKDDDADGLACSGPGGNFSAHSFILLPPKQGELWNTLQIGRLGSGMTVGSFFSNVWIGNEQRGFSWWADSDQGWFPDDAVPAHQVLRDGRQIVFRNNLIGKARELKEPRTVRFTYMASPFRPLARGWRSSLFSLDGTFGNYKDYKFRKLPDGTDYNGWNLLTPPSDNPREWDALWAEYKKKAEMRLVELPYTAYGRNGDFVHTSVPMLGYGYKSRDARVTSYFQPEWGESECYAPSNVDYYLWLADQAFRKGGLKTIYWDVVFPQQHRSLQNGMGYVLPDGRIQPVYGGLNARMFLMRMYALMEEHGLTPGGQVAHCTNAYLLPALPWLDALLDGEFLRITDESAIDWVDGYPPERMRTLSVAHNWGTAISWMNHIMIQDAAKSAKVSQGFAWYVRLYDAWIGPNHAMPREVLDWGIDEPGVEYVPFWRSEKFLKASDPDILISMWRLPNRVLLCVFNHAKQPKTANVKIALDQLGLLPANQWTEHIGLQDLLKPSSGTTYNDMRTTKSGVALDVATQELRNISLEPRMGMLLSIRKY